MFKDLAEFLKSLKGLRWYTIVFIFLSFVLYSFNHEIVRLIDLEWSDKDIVVESLKNDILIEDSLYGLLDKTNSDRAYIFRFHNGVQYYNGSHKSKMSCDYEVVRKGISREAERLQDLPTGLYSRWLSAVLRGEMYVVDVNTMTNLRVKHSLLEQGIEAIAVEAYYREGKVFALIGIDYVNKLSQKEIDSWNDSDNKKTSRQGFKRHIEEIGDLLL